MNRNYALIIAVEDYRAYDASGKADLPGAQNDAAAWVRSCLAIGFPAENIRVLTSPSLSAKDLGPGTEKIRFGTAKRQDILDGLDWLSDKVGGDEPVSGLVTFTGHGDEGNAGAPVLFPSDTTPPLLAERIEVANLRKLASPQVKANITMMLDCCHANAGTAIGQHVGRLARALNLGIRPPQDIRSVASCQRNQTSVLARFSGKTMGAFTWAVTSVIGQWSTVVEEGVARLDVSHGELLARATSLLSSLSFHQTPTLGGPVGVSDLAFLHPGTKGHAGETSPEPTAARRGMELDPDYYVMDINYQSNYFDIEFINALTSPERWTPYTSNIANKLPSARDLRLYTTGATAPPGGSSAMQENDTGWSAATGSDLEYPSGTSAHNFSGSYSGGALAICLETSARGTETVISRVTWFNTTGANIRLSSGETVRLTPDSSGAFSGSPAYKLTSTLS